MPAAFDRCVRKARARGARNPYAVCRAAMGTDAQIRAKHKRRRKRRRRRS